MIALPVALPVMGASAVLASAEAQTCRATAADVQALRDDLEIVRNQLRAARNETGYEKQPASDAMAAALVAFEQAAGQAMEPSPGAKPVTLPRATKHPRAEVIHQAFEATRRAFDRARCALPGPVEPLQKAMADLDRALQFR